MLLRTEVTKIQSTSIPNKEQYTRMNVQIVVLGTVSGRSIE